MARISVGAAIGAGFGLIRRQPLSVVAWGVIPVAMQVATIAVLAPLYASIYGGMFSSMAAGGPPTLPMATMSPHLAQMEGIGQLLNLVQLFVSSVVYCAVFRSVVHPEKSSFAYLRIGAPEFLLAVLTVAGAIAAFVAMLVVMIPVGIVAGVLMATTHSGVVLAIILPLAVLASLIGLLFVALRFSMVGPMMVDDGHFHLFESWNLTRGKVGSLFLIALGLVGVLLVFEILILAVLIGIGAGAVGALGGVDQVVALFQHSPQQLLDRIWPFLVVYGLIMIPVAGFALAIGGAPFARAYLDLKSDAADAFA
jgi:hypothetical protein